MEKHIIRGMLFIFCAVMATSLMARYQTAYSQDFESGRLPMNTQIIGEFPKRAKIVNLNANLIPRIIQDTASRKTTKQGCLALQAIALPKSKTAPKPSEYVTGIAFKTALKRSLLGYRGKALLQADFYLPEEGRYLPSLGILAMEPYSQYKKSPERFYRFGITKNKQLYFSYVDTNKATADIFKLDKQMLKTLPRGCWHRFSLVFEGSNKIHCYIDNQEPSFSPIIDNSLKQLQVGLMLAEPDKTYTCFVDNPTIQWSNQNDPLPLSPFTYTWVSGSNQTPTTITQSRQSYQPRNTYGNTQKPKLYFLYAPIVPSAKQLDRVMQTHAQAKQFLKNYEVIKLDVTKPVNQEFGRTFKVYRYPTFVICNPDGSVKTRAFYQQDTQWRDFEKLLR